MKARDRQTGLFKEVFVKALDSLPVGSEIDFDGITSDIPVGWEETTDVNSYSTSEIKTNKTWIDGKPIYKKTFVASITGHNITVGNITNLDIITYCNSYLHRDGGTYHNINNWGKSTEDFGTTYRHNNDIVFDSSYNGTLYITLEYTKTTDEGSV